MLALLGSSLAIGHPQSGAINAGTLNAIGGEAVKSTDQSAHHQQIATIRMARSRVSNKASVAELTEKQVTAATTVFYVGHKNSLLDSELRKTSESDAMTDKDPVNHKAQATLGSRCGFSWDDAAVKCGHECVGFCMTGMCFKDLPGCDHNFPSGQCFGVKQGVSDAWCVESSKSIDGPFGFVADFYDKCICEELTIGANTPIEELHKPINATKMAPRSPELVAAAMEREKNFPGLPDCTWKPGDGCSNETQYECMAGSKAGECSGDNWYYKANVCTSSCVHTALLAPAPYFAVWRPGPRALPWTDKDIMPHYASKEGSNVKDWVEHFHQPKQILMSTYCKSNQIEFVGVSLFSPAYEVKALRMLESCNKLGVCCKATEMPGDFLGASAPEGSDEFRYRTIALKPVFLLDQLEKTKEPVVFLDVDLEFHKFPDLFLPNSWPEGSRDVALFNFWANETNLTIRHTPNVGSAVAFFNQTYRSKKLLAAWAEAMQYGTNSKAPDDQVLDKLMKEGGWLKRVSVGWLPASYLRLMPSFYRGVDPIIDHDRGTKPGVAGHSSVKPLLPPVMWTEKIDAAELKADNEAAGRTEDGIAALPAGSR